MTPADFKGYADSVIRLSLVFAVPLLFWRAMELAAKLPNDTLLVSLASGGAGAGLMAVLQFWFGNSHKSPPPPDTTTTTVTKSPSTTQEDQAQ